MTCSSAVPSRDWVDFTKVAIPQADEQQRLLANLIGFMNQDRKPLPRFWYLPNGHRAAVVMTGDDHANNGTEARFNQFAAASPPGVQRGRLDVRARDLVHLSVNAARPRPGRRVQRRRLRARHPRHDRLPRLHARQSLQTAFTNDLSAFSAAFPGLPAPRTNRTHCIVWSDYTSQAEVSLASGIRLDTNYYYWPDTWVNDRPGSLHRLGLPDALRASRTAASSTSTRRRRR